MIEFLIGFVFGVVCAPFVINVIGSVWETLVLSVVRRHGR